MSGDDDQPLLAAHRALVEAGVIEPLGRVDADERRWMDLDLASRLEGHCHQVVDVSALVPAERDAWWERVSGPHERELSPHAWDWLQPYWLLDGGARVGTLALECRALGRRLVGISSLYVLPGCRRRGIAGRAIERTFDAVTAGGLDGVRIDTSWTWQPAVRFYAGRGLWLRSWTHDLTFIREVKLPPYRVEIDGDEARFLVRGDDLLLAAERDGARLQLTEVGPTTDTALWYARPTFSLHLALGGWPLVRSAEHWAERSTWMDTGMPEGLAYKIALFEEVDRRRGFEVRTPRIPGLDYGVAAAALDPD